MRIISQDGTLDFPYEEIMIRKEGVGNKSIHCYLADGRGQHYFLAEYSSAEKADSVIDMMHEEYTRHYRSFPDQYFGFVPPKIFKFPVDDDADLEEEETCDAET